MSLEIGPLEGKHLEDAATLVSRRYQGLHQQVGSLPDRYAKVSTLLGLLQDIVNAGSGAVAIQGGRLVGFLSGWLTPSFRGKRSVFSPEWGNGAALEDSRRIYEEMYTYLSASWVASGYLTHLITMLVNDRDAIEGWNWLGFGMIAADAVRDLHPAPGTEGSVSTRRASLEDIEEVLALDKALHQHLASPPIFLIEAQEDDQAYYQRELQNSDRAIWLAYRDTEAVAYLELGPASRDASTIILDDKTASIVGAFTKEAVRGRGIGTTLLNRGLEWARVQGYERCAVDFEPMNRPAARFWLNHFQPVCYSLVRHVDERAA